MTNLTFSIQIEAPKEKVWKVLWDDRYIRLWRGLFSEDQHVVTEWNEGGRILFLNRRGGSRYGVIERSRPEDFMSFRYLGEITGGKEIPQTGGQKPCSLESYTLTESGGLTELVVDVEADEEHLNHFNKQFPKALENVKSLVLGKVLLHQ